tara:strand:- start:338 stop:577 length:240 start_codon:yes stop_codon:yes gene_type:complete
MPMLTLAKPTDTSHSWNKGQKCWVVWVAGTNDARVVGRFRGKGRYVKGWLHDGRYRIVGEIEVARGFRDRLSKKSGWSL